jgi:hypothetical protein
MLLSAIAPELREGYVRFYLAQAGVRATAAESGAAFDRTFVLPTSVQEALRRQIDIILSGI